MQERGRGLAVRAALVISATVAAAIVLALVLAFVKFEQRMQDVSAARLAQVIDEVRGQTEKALRLGLDLAELEDLAALLQRAGRARDVLQIDLVDPRGIVVFSTDSARVSSVELRLGQLLSELDASPATHASDPANGLRHQVAGERLILWQELLDGLGQPAGWVVLRASLFEQRQVLQGLALQLMHSMVPILGLSLVLAFLLVVGTLRLTLQERRAQTTARDRSSTETGRLAASHDPIRTLVFRLTAVTLGFMLILSAATSVVVLNQFERVLFPELRLKAEGVAEIMTRQIHRALDYDIPLSQLPGLTESLARGIEGQPDIVYVAVERWEGPVIAEVGRRLVDVPAHGAEDLQAEREVLMPLLARGVPIAQLRIQIDPEWLKRASTDLMLELASVILVSVLVSFEILLLLVYFSVASGRLRFPQALAASEGVQDGASLADHRTARGTTRPADPLLVRLPIFLFCLSEEFSRPFMPTYAGGLAPTAPWLPVDLAVSLPITLFMLVWALSQPFGARLSGWMGRRSAFLLAALLASLGLVMASFAQDLVGFLIGRCVTALGYGIALIAAQGLIVDQTTTRNRASGLAHFVGALLAAGVCGPIAGGIIADQAGPAATLLVGAGVALGAGVVALWLLPSAGRRPIMGSSGGLGFALPRLLREWRFVSLMLFSAIPAKIAATGVLFVLIPLLLTEAGADKAQIGRVQMLYFLAFILFAPVAAKLSDQWQSRRGFIIVGGLATLAGLGLIMLGQPNWTAAVAMTFFGAAQAMLSTPQLSLVAQLAQYARVTEMSAIGWYRLLERLGGALGPLLGMMLAAIWSYQEAVVGLGLICGLSALIFWWLFRDAATVSSHVGVKS